MQRFHLPKLSNLRSKLSLFCLLLFFDSFKDLYYKSQVKTTEKRNGGVEWKGANEHKAETFLPWGEVEISLRALTPLSRASGSNPAEVVLG